MKRNPKWKIPCTVLERQTLCFSSYKNRKIKVKLWWVGACERKKRAFFVLFILSEGIFVNICVLSQCIVYWIHFENIHTFTYQKNITSCSFWLVFKVVESLQCILKSYLVPLRKITCLKLADQWFHKFLHQTMYEILPLFIVSTLPFSICLLVPSVCPFIVLFNHLFAWYK